MTRIKASGDCGNSPKNKFVQDIAIALEAGKSAPDMFSETVVWEGVHEAPLKGQDALSDVLATLEEPAVITVEHAISHGKVGAASGEVTFNDGRIRRFSHVVEFTNAKANCVAVIKSYA